ncbi:MAG TPA: hypothetical protein VK789_28310 [Bryobacteraceae bacterium]|jgi:hypothetical protein|nr:hypothetical protein [Bryobacteraceae bacterium]
MTLNILNAHTFACGRTCTPGKECGFGPIFRALGPTRVVSHTVKVTVELRNREALTGAILNMKGEVLGEGQFYIGGMQNGFGFRLPNWQYPLCLLADNNLAFDDYNGRWGKVEDIKTLEGHYAVEVGRLKANELGWMNELQANGDLLIYYPAGGTMTVKANGSVETSGFVGTGCDVSAAIENAIGTAYDRVNTEEYFIEEAHIRQQ